jgi:AhpD family alkylhydroperoxidase
MSFLREAQLEKEFGPSVVFREALGFLPNLIRAQCLLPRVIEAQAKLEDAVRLREGELSRAQKERILLTIAAARRDTYCIAMHSRVLSSLGLSDREIDHFLNDYRTGDLSAADLASLQFSLKLSHHAINPEKLIPRTLATPVRRPIAASCAMVEKSNCFFSIPTNGRDDVVRHDLGFTKRMLRGRRIKPPGPPVPHGGTIP